MFIRTQDTDDPTALRFLPGRPVLPAGRLHFAGPAEAGRSPLARRLFEVSEGVAGVELGEEDIVVHKADGGDWQALKPTLLGAIMEHFTAGLPVVLDQPDDEPSAEEEAVGEQVRELLDTRIKPVAHQQGGDVHFRGFRAGAAILEFEGPAYGLKAGVQNMLQHYVPEVRRVVDYVDTLDKPGLDTAEGRAIQALLDEQINPAVAAHGGHIALVDVSDDTAYIRLEGGCQGCGMADVTLKQGVEVAIMEAVPSIARVLDTTDHAGGANPYFQPGKGGFDPA